jgi:cytochrome c-type biogenesis protein CcmE
MNQNVNDDEIGTSADSLDLSPRPVSARQQRKRRPWPAIIVLLLVVATGGIVLTKFLTSAIDYYCNVDEIGTKSGCESGRRLRIQGVVDEGSVENDGVTTKFDMSFGGETLPVTYDGEPGGIFKECIPVVVHGILSDGVFLGDRVEVKHSNDYKADNPDRVEDEASAAEGTSCLQ